ncbi:MAG: tyrosine-type recombinase/integrase [Planctomycetaceae bacterium]|nr:tyrosine-type recombinase/integrase [Planctomycetaceae bacterium]MCB9952126.1 tyrosine-type recombinase/integrase [Planctomycetaceae bacterium]
MPISNRKQRKPYPDFPLTAHRNGQWCKKIRGKLHYFGTDADAALRQYLNQRDDLQAGRQPRTTTGAALRDLVNHYLTAASRRRDAGELSALSFRDYKWTAEQMIGEFGATVDPEQIRPLEFGRFRTKLAKKYASSRVAKTVTVCRMIFRWGYESEILDKLPRFGPDFKATTKRAQRISKAANGPKFLANQTIQKLLEHADPNFKTMILLGINAGFGNTDIANLKQSMLSLDDGWVLFPRPKTGVERKVPLWNETVSALRETISKRPDPVAPELHEDKVFLTSRGRPLVVVRSDGGRIDKITIRFRKLLKRCDAYRRQMGFYWLRHSFQTVADEARDPVATSSIMGHVDASMAGQYREAISDKRLRRVTDHVHDWLFEKSQ